ncbi:hypothetical protein CR513_29595, partial [Mucuna pruriens]
MASNRLLVNSITNFIKSLPHVVSSESKYIFLVLYVDDIILASSDTSLLHETKRFLTKNFKMKDLGEASFVLGIQICHNNELERNEMQKISYVSIVGSLMYAQVCTCSDIAFVVGVLVKCMMRYLKRTNRYTLTYQMSDKLEIIRYFDFDFTKCQDNKYSTSGYI